jgi:uroporphyrinogen-III synthase
MSQRRVLVTRAARDARVLCHALSVAGYSPVRVPLLERVWEVESLATALLEVGPVDILVVTSATTAEVLGAARPCGWEDTLIAAVGPRTAARMESLGFHVDCTPAYPTARHLVAELGDLTGKRVLYPRSNLAAESTLSALSAAGAEVFGLTAYRNQAPARFRDDLKAVLPIAATTLMSASAAQRLADVVQPGLVGQVGRVAAIGPTTAAAARNAGLRVHAVAETPSVKGIIEAVERALAVVMP